jgi:small subunit ribosomal protein S4
MKKNGSKSPHLARQMVVHKHVSIGDRFVNIPGYLVKRDEEEQILLHMTVGAQSQPQ